MLKVICVCVYECMCVNKKHNSKGGIIKEIVGEKMRKEWDICDMKAVWGPTWEE